MTGESHFSQGRRKAGHPAFVIGTRQSQEPRAGRPRHMSRYTLYAVASVLRD
jgi:hypothetical protein